MAPRRTVAAAGFAIGLCVLVLQFFVIMPLSLEAGRGLIGSVIYYFSFFTILTNIGVALVYLGALIRGQRWLVLFRKPHTRAMVASSIALVGGFYHFVLAGQWQQAGLLYWCNIALHYVTPVIYLIWYAVWNRTGTLKWKAVATLLAYPLIYLLYVMVRGPIAGEYPYAVLDVGDYGYGQVAVNVAGLLVLLLVLNTIAIAVDRSLLATKRA